MVWVVFRSLRGLQKPEVILPGPAAPCAEKRGVIAKTELTHLPWGMEVAAGPELQHEFLG